jgi:hypothetical protein
LELRVRSTQALTQAADISGRALTLCKTYQELMFKALNAAHEAADMCQQIQLASIPDDSGRRH